VRTPWSIALAAVGFAFAATDAQAQLLPLPLPGWQAQLDGSGASVGVAGTVTIVDQFTLLFEDFSYDGRGAGETDIVLVPFTGLPENLAELDPVQGVAARFDALQDFFFSTPNARDVSVTVLDNLRSSNPAPGLPPGGGDSPPIMVMDGNFTITIGRDNFGAGTAGDMRFQEFVDNNGVLNFSTISVFCHPQFFDFGSGFFLPPEPDADFNDNGGVDGFDFLEWQRSIGPSQISVGTGDANLDSAVDGIDLAAFESQFGSTGGGSLLNADFNDSGFVDGFDFLEWQRNVGPPSIQAVPGDATLDRFVDAEDLAVFESQFGTTREIPGLLPGSFDEEFPDFFGGLLGGLSASTERVPEPGRLRHDGHSGKPRRQLRHFAGV